jgi:hypothetical protein
MIKNLVEIQTVFSSRLYGWRSRKNLKRWPPDLGDRVNISAADTEAQLLDRTTRLHRAIKRNIFN